VVFGDNKTVVVDEQFDASDTVHVYIPIEGAGIGFPITTPLFEIQL
jgi:hypothetical protein